MNIGNRTIFTGDNLEVLRGFDSNIVDLIYLDPPFNSNRDYAAPVGSKAAGAAFKDTWTLSDLDVAWAGEVADRHPAVSEVIHAARTAHGAGMMSYLTMMAVRLIELRRVLKPEGSIYLHCDDTAGSYLRVLMDSIFGRDLFRNEITWQRTGSAAKGSQHKSKTWGANTDRLLFYSGGTVRPLRELTEAEIMKKFPKVDEHGERYNTATPLFCSKTMGDRPNLCFTWKGFTNPHPSGWRLSKPRLEEELEKGNIVITGDHIERRAYLRDYKGVPAGNLWTDLTLASGSSERVGYPTQKPLALLTRIIEASSNPGDLVLDPFCGCATACVAAEDLGRQWVGIDLSEKAFDLVRERLGLTDFVANHRTDLPTRSDIEAAPDYRTLKHTLYGLQEGRCGFNRQAVGGGGCGQWFPFRNLTRDHIVPQSKGGHEGTSNAQLLCAACNSVKGDRPQAYLTTELLRQGVIR